MIVLSIRKRLRKIAFALFVCSSLAIQLTAAYRIYRARRLPFDLASASRDSVTEPIDRSIGSYVSIKNIPAKGQQSAEVILMDFTDYECSYCRSYFGDTLPAIQREYLDTGKIRYAVFNFPLSIHKDARRRSTFAVCAGRQQKYWQAHDHIFELMKDPVETEFVGALDLNPDDFGACLGDKSTEAIIDHDIDLGKRLGVGGTPTFYLGIVSEADPFNAQIRSTIRGTKPFAIFKEALDQLLNSSRKDASSSRLGRVR